MQVESSATPLLTEDKAGSLPGQFCPFHFRSTLDRNWQKTRKDFAMSTVPRKYSSCLPLLQNEKSTLSGSRIIHTLMCRSDGRGTQRQFSGKYLFRRRFENQNFRNICCKISCTYRITGLHYTYGGATLCATKAGQLYIENHQVTLQLRMRHLKYSLCWLPLLSESLGLTSLIGFQPLVQPMLVRCTCRMTELSYTSGCPPYFYELFLRNHWVTLHLLVSILKCSL